MGGGAGEEEEETRGSVLRLLLHLEMYLTGIFVANSCIKALE